MIHTHTHWGLLSTHTKISIAIRELMCCPQVLKAFCVNVHVPLKRNHRNVFEQGEEFEGKVGRDAVKVSYCCGRSTMYM